MRAKPLSVFWLAIALTVSATWAAPKVSHAREVIGGDEEEEEEVPAPQKPGRAAPAPGASNKKDSRKAARARSGKTMLQQEKEREAAEEAALKKAAAARQRQKEAAAARQRELELRRSAKKAQAGKAQLDNAKISRRYTRKAGGLLLEMRARPGAVVHNTLTSFELEVSRTLDEADPTFGNSRPLSDAYLVAVLSQTSGPPQSNPKAAPVPLLPPVAYVIHPLVDAGKYGFHATLPAAGTWELKIQGQHADKPVEVTIPLYVDQWPPPDFDKEEDNNRESGASGGSRAILE